MLVVVKKGSTSQSQKTIQKKNVNFRESEKIVLEKH